MPRRPRPRDLEVRQLGRQVVTNRTARDSLGPREFAWSLGSASVSYTLHELMHRAFGNTPMWLNEGLADYFSTLRIEGDRVVLGEIVRERAIPDESIPSALETVRANRAAFQESGALTSGRYYKGAWLLVHFLRDGPALYRSRFDVLAGALNAGRSSAEAWNIAMKGITASQLEGDFRAHLRAFSWPLYGKKIDPPSTSAIVERAMRPAEVHLLWARVAKPHHGDRSLASREIGEAAALEPDSAEVAYVRGCAAMAADDKTTAASAFKAALAHSPNEPRYLYGVALATGDCGSVGMSGVTVAALCDSLVARARSPEENALAAAYLANTGHVDDAFERAKKAYGADGRCFPCAATFADLLAAKGDTRRAIAVLEQSLSASAETPQDRVLAKMLERFRLGGGPHPAAAGDAPEVAAPIGEPDFCPGECTGHASAPLLAALSARAGQTRSCYQRALVESTELRGRSRVSVRVAEDGRVCGARIVASDMPASMNTCLLQVLGAGRYPPAAGGCVEMNVPIAFSPQDATTGSR